MAKGFGKFLLGTAIAAAAAAGVYYLLKSNPLDDDFDDFDDPDDDLEEFLKEETEQAEKADREYIPLDSAGKSAENEEPVLKDSPEGSSGAKTYQFSDLTSDES